MRPVEKALWLGFLLTSFFFLSLLCMPATDVDAQMYKYTDKRGTIHFTDRYESIPEEYRNQVKVIREEPRPTSPKKNLGGKEIGREGGIPGRAPSEKMIEEKKAEDEAKKAQEAQERAAREAKLKARLEKQKKIAELQDQIRAKVDEQKSLRTTWMVYDRTRLIQLNQEIAALEKEIESIQKELAEEK